MEAFAALGYKPEQVTKILLTHKHNDHSGELKSFPNAKIYVNADEISADELKGLENIIPVTFTDGAYYNFPDSQKIADGIYFIKAKGHTNGNSIVIVENNGLFYMLHGDIGTENHSLNQFIDRRDFLQKLISAAGIALTACSPSSNTQTINSDSSYNFYSPLI